MIVSTDGCATISSRSSPRESAVIAMPSSVRCAPDRREVEDAVGVREVGEVRVEVARRGRKLLRRGRLVADEVDDVEALRELDEGDVVVEVARRAGREPGRARSAGRRRGRTRPRRRRRRAAVAGFRGVTVKRRGADATACADDLARDPGRGRSRRRRALPPRETRLAPQRPSARRRSPGAARARPRAPSRPGRRSGARQVRARSAAAARRGACGRSARRGAPSAAGVRAGRSPSELATTVALYAPSRASGKQTRRASPPAPGVRAPPHRRHSERAATPGSTTGASVPKTS